MEGQDGSSENVSVDVRDSKVHGKGVFATRDIAENEFVCIFDGDLLKVEQILKEKRHRDKDQKTYWMSHPRDPDLILCGFKVPQSRLGVGQLINDGKKPVIEDLDFKIGIKACEEYVVESRRMQNVAFAPDGKDFHIHAKRNIAKGEELFLHYGYKMWLRTMGEGLEGDEAYLFRLFILDS